MSWVLQIEVHHLMTQTISPRCPDILKNLPDKNTFNGKPSNEEV